jgi:hypothetical protein
MQQAWPHKFQCVSYPAGLLGYYSTGDQLELGSKLHFFLIQVLWSMPFPSLSCSYCAKPISPCDTYLVVAAEHLIRLVIEGNAHHVFTHANACLIKVL